MGDAIAWKPFPGKSLEHMDSICDADGRVSCGYDKTNIINRRRSSRAPETCENRSWWRFGRLAD
jgi:hypothetical protein